MNKLLSVVLLLCLLISCVSCAGTPGEDTTPAATTLTQFAQVFEKDARYACAINVVTTILCIATIPVMVALYQM
jgi:predicted permease